MEQVKIEISMQGKPIVNEGWIIHKYDDIVAIEVDMRSKNCGVLCTTSTTSELGICIPGIIIGINEYSLYLDKSAEYDETEIEFADFIGWRIFCAELARYTLYVCLVKERE